MSNNKNSKQFISVWVYTLNNNCEWFVLFTTLKLASGKSTVVYTSNTCFYFLFVLQVHVSRSTFTRVAFSMVTFTFTQVQNKCTCYSSNLNILYYQK